MSLAKNSLFRWSSENIIDILFFIIATMVLLTSLVVILWAKTVPVEERISGYRISDSMKNGRHFEWPYSYTLRGNEVILRIKIVFDKELGWTAEQKASYQNRVKTEVESVWNKEPLILTIDFGEPADQTVKLHKGIGHTNMTNWYSDYDKPQYKAHEVGHMLGLFDEYKKGATSDIISADGLMGNAMRAVMYERYYEPWKPHESKHLDTIKNVPLPKRAVGRRQTKAAQKSGRTKRQSSGSI